MKGGGKLQKILDGYSTGEVTVNVGFLDSKTYEDGTYVADVAYKNEYGSDTNQPRPFFRSAIEQNKNQLGHMASSLMSKGFTEEETIGQLGDYMVGQVTESIATWTTPRNRQATIDKKGFNAPLRETKTMLRSVSMEMKDGD